MEFFDMNIIWLLFGISVPLLVFFGFWGFELCAKIKKDLEKGCYKKAYYIIARLGTGCVLAAATAWFCIYPSVSVSLASLLLRTYFVFLISALVLLSISSIMRSAKA